MAVGVHDEDPVQIVHGSVLSGYAAAAPANAAHPALGVKRLAA